MSDRSDDWFALHVFLGDPLRMDAFIQDWLHPRARALCAGGAKRWFFIRYWEGGPHLRVRFQGLAEREGHRLAEDIRAVISAYVSNDSLGPEEYAEKLRLDGYLVGDEDPVWHSEGKVLRFDYEPERLRYGGIDAMGPNEHLFHLSSEVAASLIRATAGAFPKRLSVAGALMLQAALACCRNDRDVARFFENYTDFWSRYPGSIAAAATPRDALAPDPQLAAAIRRALDSHAGATDTSIVGAWASALNDLCSGLQVLYDRGLLQSPTGSMIEDTALLQTTLESIISSQMHMLNNRLGVSPSLEVTLSTRLAEAARLATDGGQGAA